MAILENIRKRTTVLILIIGLALFAFVISGVFTNSNFAGGKVGSSVAEVNGNEIPIDEFRRKVEVASNRFGPSASSMHGGEPSMGPRSQKFDFRTTIRGFGN